MDLSEIAYSTIPENIYRTLLLAIIKDYRSQYYGKLIVPYFWSYFHLIMYDRFQNEEKTKKEIEYILKYHPEEKYLYVIVVNKKMLDGNIGSYLYIFSLRDT